MAERSIATRKLVGCLPAPTPVAKPGDAPARLNWLAPAALVAAVFLAYQPTWRAEFIWDDDSYVTNNKTLHNLDGLWRIWSDWHANPQYYPLVHTTFWVEYHLWKLKPLGYHLVNILLHAANVLLLWLVLRRLAVPGAFWAAALFAVHPVEVESVAWITERKNVLSTVCYFASFLSFLRFWPPEESKPQPAGRWRYYAWALLLFAAALFSKTVTCSLPAVFLLVRWWKQGRVSLRDLLVTAPLFVLGLSLGLITAHLEKEQVGAHGADWDFSPIQRLLIAGRAVWFYAGKLVCPTDLTFIYPRWEINAQVWWQYLFPAAALGLVVALWVLRARIGRGPLVAILFFGGTLVPALGFFNVYPMRFSFVADHFQYLATAGLFVLFAAGMERLGSRFASEQSRVVGAAFCVLLAVLAVLTWQQARIYKDAMTLWNDTLAKNPGCWMAWNNRGALSNDDEAIADYRNALDIKPDFFDAQYNLGKALFARGQVDEAITQFRKVLEIEPNFAEAYNHLGLVLAGRGQIDEAIAQYQKALEIKPDFAFAHNNLGNVLAGRGQVDEAIVQYRNALEIKPDYADAHNNLGLALAGRGQVDEAIAHYRKALEFKPDFALAHYNLALAFADRKQANEAVAHYRKALEIEPNYADAHCNLGSVLAACGHAEEAIVHYRKALEIKPDFIGAHYNLAAALLDCGQVDRAISQYQKALDLAAARNDRALADSIRAQIGRLHK